MMKKLDRTLSALAPVLCCALGAGLCIVSCEGTETDNPVSGGDVFDGTSPEDLVPADIPPGCPPPSEEQQPMTPWRVAQSVIVPSAGPGVIASGTYAGGLSLVDASDPDRPVELSRGVVRGEIHHLLVASSGELWVLATEPPAPSGAAVPSATEIDRVLRLVRVDVSDPTRPVRIAEASLDGEGWEVRELGGEAWVLSARRDESQRGCAAQENPCGYASYEALLLRGFRADGAALEPIGEVELPFEQRAWWRGDGVVTNASDGTLNGVSWAGSGAARRVLRVPGPGAEVQSGPAEIAGNELSVLRIAPGQARVDVYDLDSDGASPVRTLPLATELERAGVHSLFAAEHLWLQAPFGQVSPAASAELWDLSGTAPVRVALPGAYHTLLPILGAVRSGAPDELLALAASRDAVGNEELRFLSIQGGQASVLEGPELAVTNVSLVNGFEAPPALRGAGEAPAWTLRTPALGSPILIQPALSTAGTSSGSILAFVGVAAAGRAPGESVPSEAITRVALVGRREAGRGNLSALELSGATPSRRIELSPLMYGLAPVAGGVVTVATAPASECEQRRVDCTGYAPGVSVYELAGEPRLVASVPFPELPLPAIDDPNHVSVRWDLYDPLTQQQPAALALGERRLAFVASVDLSCDRQEDCDALDIPAVPFREANVIAGGVVDCAPGGDPSCVPGPVAEPAVWGQSSRQYFYVLDLDAAGGPAFETWGVSRLAATAARTDRDSRFAFPLATDGVLAATRLERRGSATDPNDRGETRFFLDRFERSPSGELVELPGVNVPGYPMARLGATDTRERWLSVEAGRDDDGAPWGARLHRMNIQSDGARIEQSLELGGRFAGFRTLAAGGATLGLALSAPADGCGTSELSTIALGTNPADAGEPLAVASTLELPSDAWTIAATDGDLALLRRDAIYLLVRVTADGTLAVVSWSSIDEPLGTEQLIGTSVYGSGRVVDLSALP